VGAICGIDWASDWHDVHIADQQGIVLAAEQFAHDERGIGALIALLEAHAVQCCAIERPDGLLVGRLMGASIPVLAIHPNQVKAARDRFRAAAGKNDRFDAFVLCELARTDHHRFQVLEPDSDQTKAIRALTRAREDLVAARVAELGGGLGILCEKEALDRRLDGKMFANDGDQAALDADEA